MLKFIKNIHYGSNKSLSWSNSWFIPNYQIISLCSHAASSSQPQIDQVNQEKAEPSKIPTNKPSNQPYSMTNYVFKSIRNDIFVDMSEDILKAKTVEDLLKISEKEDISKKSIALIHFILDYWISQKKIAIKNYKDDPRFKKLMKTKSKFYNYKEYQVPFTLNDFNKIFDVSNLTPDQCLIVLSNLAVKHTRLKPVIRSVLIKINENVKSFNFKKTTDVLFFMAKLNFLHDELLQNLCKNILKSIDTIEQSPIIGSIVTSLGILRYRNDELLNKISNWFIKHKKIVRTRDVCSLHLTLGFLGFRPSNHDVFIQELIAPMSIINMSTSLEWIDVVWALSIFNRATPQHLQSVLNESFINSFSTIDEIPFAKQLKLLNINSIAMLLTPDYKGPFLNHHSPLFISSSMKSKEKQIFITAITDALENLFPSKDFFNANFVDEAELMIDVIFYYDKKKKQPIPVTEYSSHETTIRIAVIANTFHDYSSGEKSLLGPALLHYRLLQAQGYQIIDISYEQFSPSDSLLKRITYMNDRIKSIIKDVM